MPRPPKNKAAGEPAKIGAAPARSIDVDNFIRVRDSVFSRLNTLHEMIRDFSVDYLRQTNLLLGEGTNFDAVPQFNAYDVGVVGVPLAPMPPAASPVEEKKERKKRTHDPNAPKRPLTPYFLYMQTARPIIAGDLGEGAPRGAVQEEGQRRWGVMDDIEKPRWYQAYQYNLRLYNARVHSYKGGNPEARDMDDNDALKYADQHGITANDKGGVDHDAAGDDHVAIAEQLQAPLPAAVLATKADPAAGADESTAKTPKKTKGPVKRRSTATPAVEAVAAPPPAAVSTPASPAQKRKRASKAADTSEEPKKSGRKKAKA